MQRPESLKNCICGNYCIDQYLSRNDSKHCFYFSVSPLIYNFQCFCLLCIQYVLMSPIATSSCPMFSVNFRVYPQHAIQSQSIMCNRSTFFRFPSNTHLISASHLFSSHNEKTCTCAKCLCAQFSKLSHPSFAFTMALMQLYLKLPCVSFSFERLEMHTRSD